MKRTLRNLVAISLALIMLFGMTNALAEDKVVFTVGAFDLPTTLESSDEISVEGAPYYDARWAMVLDKFNAKTEYVAYAYGTANEQATQMINGGTMPDTLIGLLGATAGRGYAEEGLLGLLPAGIEEKYPNIKRALELIPIRGQFQLNGQYFCLPRALEATEPYTDYDAAIFFRKDLAAAAGIEIKDVYTIDELYEMYEKVQAQNPEMTMFSHLTPEEILDIGLISAEPHILPGYEWYRNDEGTYIYAWAQPETLEGIMTFKKFYDAGFLKKEFFNDAAYVARDEFSNNTVFSYWDGLGMDFYNNVLDRYASANPGVNPEEKIACAWIAVKGDKVLAKQGGNTWSEIYFSPEAVKDEQKLDTILSIYDYLLSPEGVLLNNFGIEGVHYNLDENGAVIDIRPVMEGTDGAKTPFNANSEVKDFAPIVMAGAFADTSVLEKSQLIRQYAKDEYHRLFDLRKNPDNIYLLPYDAEMAAFNGEAFTSVGASLKPIKVIIKILFEQKAEDVPAAWQAWLDESKPIIDEIADEINAALGK